MWQLNFFSLQKALFVTVNGTGTSMDFKERGKNIFVIKNKTEL